jgi:hypothetical protein
MEFRSKATILVGYVIVGVLAFVAGRESLRAEIRDRLREAIKPLEGFAIPEPVSSTNEPAVSEMTSTEPSWRVNEDTSAMDDSSTVTLHLDAMDSIRAWPGENHTPTLIVRCKENQTDVYIVNGASPAIEYGIDGATVRLRLDSAPAFSGEWGKSTDGDTLFAPNAVALAKKMANAQTLLYEFTPFNSSPQQARFKLTGLSEHLPKVAAACNWNV